MGDMVLRINVIYSRGSSFIRMQPGTQTHLRWVYYAAIDYGETATTTNPYSPPYNILTEDDDDGCCKCN